MGCLNIYWTETAPGTGNRCVDTKEFSATEEYFNFNQVLSEPGLLFTYNIAGFGVPKTYSLIWVLCDWDIKAKQTICEPRHDKTNKVTVRLAKTQISLASAQSDQSLHCALNG